MATLGGVDIFGDQIKQVGPEQGYRAMRHYLPGVGGCRIYRMGSDTLTIRIAGRLTGTSRVNLEFKILSALAMRDGTLRTFVGDGDSYINCLLDDYKPGTIQRVTTGRSVTHSCQINAILTQVSA